MGELALLMALAWYLMVLAAEDMVGSATIATTGSVKQRARA